MSRRARSTIEIEPRFDEVDMLGVVHNAVYFKWFEMGRLAILQRILPVQEALDMGVYLPVVKNTCEYKRPARYGDDLVLVTDMEWSGRYRGRIPFSHELTNARTRELVAVGETVVTVFDARHSKLVKDLPEDVLERIASLTGEKGGPS